MSRGVIWKLEPRRRPTTWRSAAAEGRLLHAEVRRRSHLFDTVPFLEIVPCTEELDVDCRQRRAAFGVRDVVVKMKIIGRAALNALALVAFPNLKLNCRRDDSCVLGLGVTDCHRLRRVVNDLQAELEDLTAAG